MLKLQYFYFLSVAATVALADHWGYPTEGPNGVITGDENWGGTCAEGRKQSPVDLAQAASVMGHYPSLMFQDYDVPFVGAHIRNTGHSIQLDVPEGQDYIMTGGGLPGTFLLDQMHFHWGSEHTINGDRYSLELHMVSHESRFANFSEAVQRKNGIAVLGVLFHVDVTVNAALKAILDSAEPVKDDVADASVLKRQISPGDFLPKNRDTFFRYEGSLTTPTCDEAVIWTVLKESLSSSFEQVENFKTVKSEDGDYLTNNFRLVKPLNSRTLVYAKRGILYEEDAASTITVSFLALAAAVAARFVW